MDTALANAVGFADKAPDLKPPDLLVIASWTDDLGLTHQLVRALTSGGLQALSHRLAMDRGYSPSIVDLGIVTLSDSGAIATVHRVITFAPRYSSWDIELVDPHVHHGDRRFLKGTTRDIAVWALKGVQDVEFADMSLDHQKLGFPFPATPEEIQHLKNLHAMTVLQQLAKEFEDSHGTSKRHDEARGAIARLIYEAEEGKSRGSVVSGYDRMIGKLMVGGEEVMWLRLYYGLRQGDDNVWLVLHRNPEAGDTVHRTWDAVRLTDRPIDLVGVWPPEIRNAPVGDFADLLLLAGLIADTEAWDSGQWVEEHLVPPDVEYVGESEMFSLMGQRQPWMLPEHELVEFLVASDSAGNPS